MVRIQLQWLVDRIKGHLLRETKENGLWHPKLIASTLQWKVREKNIVTHFLGYPCEVEYVCDPSPHREMNRSLC